MMMRGPANVKFMDGIVFLSVPYAIMQKVLTYRSFFSLSV
jgi:hypothetical protein